MSAHITLSYICFPFLETVARRACPAFIDSNGIVLQSFPRLNGGSYTVTKRCSNVADVLRLLRNQVAGADLQADLDEVLNHVRAIDGSTDGYETVYVWRNSSLHGEQIRSVIGSTVYSLALLIELDGIKGQYNQHRDDAWRHAQRFMRWSKESNQFPRPAWSFYPFVLISPATAKRHTSRGSLLPSCQEPAGVHSPVASQCIHQ
jgi:hypothetical protein